MNQLSLADMKAIHPPFGRDWVQSFDLAKAMDRRTGTGMPGPAQLARQFKRWQKVVG
jgi:argininosuccinate lyase